MWQVWNHTPLDAQWSGIRDLDGAEVWLVAIKGTFTCGPDGRCQLATNQEPVARAPRFAGDPQSTDLLEESDFCLTKSATDVLVRGSAYAPRHRAAKSVDVSIAVEGHFEKTLRVTGPRKWESTGGKFSLTEPEPFEVLPLTYTRAYGGVAKSGDTWCAENTIGVGISSRPEDLIGTEAPNIERPDALITTPADKPSPGGFGPIPRHWQPRLGLAGSYDDDWMKTRRPLLPKDFDQRFWQCAPSDQQVADFLKGGETIRTTHLTPEGRWSATLPRLEFQLTTRFRGRSEEQHPAELHTVLVEPDLNRLTMVWQSRLPCHFTVQRLLGTDVRIASSDIELPQPQTLGSAT
jgi:hypothetical protein